MTKESLSNPAVPLAWAANSLAQLCETIDSGADLDAAIIQHFETFKNELAARSDDVIVFLESLDSFIERSKKVRDAWADRARKLEKVLDKTKALVLETVQANDALPYRGVLGALAAQKSPKALELDVPVYARSFRNIVSDKNIETNGMHDFVNMVSFRHLDTEKVKQYLETGDLSWARLVQGHHLRIRK